MKIFLKIWQELNKLKVSDNKGPSNEKNYFSVKFKFKMSFKTSTNRILLFLPKQITRLLKTSKTRERKFISSLRSERAKNCLFATDSDISEIAREATNNIGNAVFTTKPNVPLSSSWKKLQAFATVTTPTSMKNQSLLLRLWSKRLNYNKEIILNFPIKNNHWKKSKTCSKSLIQTFTLSLKCNSN